ncbi:unnamed protein product [Phytophthora fragariaefolia]|uniref:Unnamed protein product n=1 Tax=Phytophthora fragariaefolia TaxID=1490495 RepID=A0A9W7D3L2_9STRA|nr:unnamed protein product [Phytophthora fragariaefolia]
MSLQLLGHPLHGLNAVNGVLPPRRSAGIPLSAAWTTGNKAGQSRTDNLRSHNSAFMALSTSRFTTSTVPFAHGVYAVTK